MRINQETDSWNLVAPFSTTSSLNWHTSPCIRRRTAKDTGPLSIYRFCFSLSYSSCLLASSLIWHQIEYKAYQRHARIWIGFVLSSSEIVAKIVVLIMSFIIQIRFLRCFKLSLEYYSTPIHLCVTQRMATWKSNQLHWAATTGLFLFK